MFARSLFTAISCLTLVACSPKAATGGSSTARGKVTIYSTTDFAVFQPVMRDFEKLHPEIELDYVEIDARAMYDRFLAENRSGKVKADLLLSAAMDLQVKLVNDGYAQPHLSDDAAQLPSWARWRNEIFGLTFEPVVMVANPHAFVGRKVPKSRLELVQSLRLDTRFWKKRLGTYDITASSVGYLLAAQDARLSGEYGTLIEAMGNVETKVYPNLSRLFEDIESGRLVFGYNVLGSYAKSRVAAGAKLQIIYPEDYTLAVIRAAFIAKKAPNPSGAHVFLEYLVSLRGQRILATRSDLLATREEIKGPYGRLSISGRAVGPLRPIPIGPGLMTYLDQQKYARFIRNWRGALESEYDGTQ